MENKLIILCATQRCGSTMIVDDFRSTDVLGKPEEYFIPWTGGQIEDPLKSFENIKKMSQTENGVSVIKVMADQLFYIERQLEKVFEIDESVEGSYMRCALLFKDATFIRIDRIDSVAQATSRYIAKKTGKNHFLDTSSEYIPGNTIYSNENYNANVEFDSNALDKHVIDIAKEKALWSRVMSDWNCQYAFSLSYENCINDRSYLNSIIKYFDLNCESINERKIKKIGNNKNEEIINNYINMPINEVNSFNNSLINEIRDVGYKVLELDNNLAKRLLKIVLKLRPNSPKVRLLLNKKD